MHLIPRIFLCTFSAVLLFSCSPSGALFPSDAFCRLREAYSRNDPDMVIPLLSERSKKEIKEMIGKFNRINPSARKRIASVYGVKEERLSGMSGRDFILLCLYLDRKNDAVRNALKNKIVGVDRKNKRAVIRVANGMKLFFVKEGPYWKFDMNFTVLEIQ